MKLETFWIIGWILTGLITVILSDDNNEGGLFETIIFEVIVWPVILLIFIGFSLKKILDKKKK